MQIPSVWTDGAVVVAVCHQIIDVIAALLGHHCKLDIIKNVAVSCANIRHAKAGISLPSIYSKFTLLFFSGRGGSALSFIFAPAHQ